MQQKLGKLIGKGKTASIYQWGQHHALKLFDKAIPLQSVQSEFKNTQIVSKTGLPVPDVEEIIQYNDRHGIVMSLLDGPILWDLMNSQSGNSTDHIRIFAYLHVSVNAASARDLDALNDRMNDNISKLDCIPTATKTSVLDILKDLPDGETICHSDFHPLNIIMTSKGPYIIDWIRAAKGDPLADVANTLLLASDYAVLDEIPNQKTVENLYGPALPSYLKGYFQHRDIPFGMLELWKVPIFASRIYAVTFHDSSVEIQKILLKRLQKQLSLVQHLR